MQSRFMGGGVRRVGRVGMLLALGFLAGSGCQRHEVQVYDIPKEAPPAESAAQDGGASPHGGATVPTLEWASLPEGWKSQPTSSAMRAASFLISDPSGKTGEFSAIPLAGMNGNDLEFVNMWRSQIGLGPVAAESLGKYMTPLKIAGLDGKLFDMKGSEAAQAKDPAGALVAVLAREGVTWFFKLSGDEALVQSQRATFVSFLGSVKFGAPKALPPMADAGGAPSPHAGGAVPPAAAAGGAPAAEGGAPAAPEWQVPPSWQQAPTGPMLLAKFTATGDAGARVDVTVSSFPGDVGGLPANVNRWRGQVGLPPIQAGEIAAQTTTVDLSGIQGTVVDVTGTDAKNHQPARLIGVVVPRGGQTWFYKLMGNPAVADREKAAFLDFVKSAKYSNAP